MDEREAALSGNDGIFAIDKENFFVGKHAAEVGKEAGRKLYNTETMF